jgi:hypothetical protein
MLVPLTAACLAYVASLNGLPAPLLDGLRATEGGTVGAETPNRDQAGQVTSWDIGPFQVNDRAWLHHFTVAWHQSSDEATRTMLRDNGCANALAASVIMRGCLDEAGGNVGVAVGLYNSHTAPKADAYRRHFIAAFLKSRSAVSRQGN